MEILKSKNGVIIVTMNTKEALQRKNNTNFTIRQLRSRQDTWRMWIPKTYTGSF